MNTLKIISWNVNGIRAAHKKGLLDFIKKENPDIICLQEIKALEEQLPKDLRNIEGYELFINPADPQIKKGYSGVAIYSKLKPNKEIKNQIGKEFEDKEGRILSLEFDNFILFNVYFPNGGKSEEHFEYKLNFYREIIKHFKKLKAKSNVVLCGDMNIAHEEIDLARPKENEKNIGFLPEERALITKFLKSGFTDTFRMFVKEGGHYSWWDFKTGARARNVGWRIDYFFVNNEIAQNVKRAEILSEVMGSDHCPILLEILLD